MSSTPDVSQCVCVCVCALNLGLSNTCLPSQITVSQQDIRRQQCSLSVFVSVSSSLRTSCQPAIGKGVAKVTEQIGPAVFE